ncbi:MAG TPA: hypothetical protein PLU37_15410 [Chitinophagaceae bacterium]|nr:hypothetical protein [Chitinophagaceae bacterium]
MLTSFTSAKGTECITIEFKYDHLHFNLCQNYYDYNETVTLLYEARSRQLNNFINDLIKTGKLKDKKFFIDVYDPKLTWDYIFITQSKQGYNIDCSGFLDFKELAELVYYFTQPDWSSFVYDPSKVKNRHNTRMKLLSIVERYSLPDIKPYLSSDSLLWESDGFSLKYNEDRISYYRDEELLPFKPTSSLPVKIQDRYLFFQDDSVFVLKGRSVIKTFRFPEENRGDCNVKVYRKWVNISWHSDEPQYTYSYDKNKFFNLLKAKE